MDFILIFCINPSKRKHEDFLNKKVDKKTFYAYNKYNMYSCKYMKQVRCKATVGCYLAAKIRRIFTMRKIFVVLLVLAIAGGALAQEAEVAKEGSNWTLSGEGKIATTVDFYDGAYDGQAKIKGGQADDMFIKMLWDYKKGDWTINLPFAINWDDDDDDKYWYFSTDDRDDDTFSGIKYNPNGGPLTLEVPFNLTFGNGNSVKPGNATEIDPDYQNDLAWYMVGDVGAGAVYDGGNYWFKVAFDKLNSNPVPGAIGGWYDFGENGSRLAVSYKDATDSEWWRASDIVLMAGPFDETYAWENIGGDWSDYGIAYKYALSKEFNLGVSFAGNSGNGEAGEATFTNNYKSHDSTDFRFVDDFLANFIFGMKYDGVVAVSLMSGMWSKRSGNWTSDGKKENLDVRIPLHLGAAWESKDLGISVKGDISALFDKEWKGTYGTTTIAEDKIKANFNFGIQAQYGDSDATDGFWARLLLKGLDLANETKYAPVLSTELWLAYQRNVNDDNGGWEKIDGKGKGLWAYGYLGFLDFIVDTDNDYAFPIDFKVGVGYEGIALGEKLSLGIGAEFWMSINGKYFGLINEPGLTAAQKAKYKTSGFQINPVLTWSLVENSTIELGYKIGMDGLHNRESFGDPELNINAITASFKYTF